MYLAALRMFSVELEREMQKALEAFHVEAIEEYLSRKAGPRVPRHLHGGY